MAERKRSKDGHQETRDILGEQPDVDIDQAGRAGGAPARNVATADEKKRAVKDPAGKTRVTKSLERGQEDE
ncbi:hypothetical protein [Anianabacter salinae]|uniref:hypothetical protein n=1 Tax=Anianabacter salinae TaxID=2851023 RepID=UPI00225E2C85|nr:hypothetical protein [Anianabacter salinae]MBV0911882.1 hypothetical protein [Anianabacter salinae]